MKKDIAFSLSLQKEIQKKRLCLESEVEKSCGQIGIKALLHQAGISKEKGFAPSTLLFVLILLPMIKESLTALWSGEHFTRLLEARKDTYYRFLNREYFNWRKLVTLMVSRMLSRLDTVELAQKVLIADDTLLRKTGKEMELVSYHFDHTRKRSHLGYQMLQVGYHNGMDFYPIDVSFHTSKSRPNENSKKMDRRSNGWKRRKEAFEKKTNVVIHMLKRCWQTGIDARFVLFDSWFAYDTIIAHILDIGYGVICRLKRSLERYLYKGSQLTLSQLWHDVAIYSLPDFADWCCSE